MGLKNEIKKIFPKMISEEIVEIKGTSFLILGICELDGKKYGALYDITTMQTYINEVRMGKNNDTLLANYMIHNEAEYALITNFFLENRILEINRIYTWLWGQSESDIRLRSKFDKLIEQMRKKK